MHVKMLTPATQTVRRANPSDSRGRGWRLAGLLFGAAALAATRGPAPSASSAPTVAPANAREFYNLGAQCLDAGKLREAEAAFETALARQEDRFQPPALYDLGEVRFRFGWEELKKGPDGAGAARRGHSALAAAAEANRLADEALAGDQVDKVVAAYLNGRGARRELRAATKAVRAAMKSYGAALTRWERSAGDFKSAAELVPTDADARTNAAIVDQCIAKLVDSLHDMEQTASAMGQQQQELKDKLEKLKGRMPGDEPPPGGGGEDEDDDDSPNGPKPGDQEGPSKEGNEMPMTREQAAWMLNGFRLDAERRLPMGDGQPGKPENRPRKPW
jgi:tetratricopeptide (TPR) repeat protein